MIYVLAVFNVFVATIAQMMLKKSASKKHSSVIYEYLNLWVIGGYALMGFSLISNVYAMSQGVQLKEMGAIGASKYLFFPILASICVKEKFNKKKIFSIMIIFSGSIVFFS